MTTPKACLLLNLLSATALAQGMPSSTPSQLRALSERPGFWHVPIHTHAEVPGYGIWAADRDYKASFHDGFVFYPQLGRSYPENLPLRWTTTKITAGGEPIADLQRAHTTHTDSRFEYRYSGVTEAYDVRADGVEQTFVIATRPREAGDLVVEGRFDTKLVPLGGNAPAACAGLVFADARGVPLVQYGQAFALDANGNRTEVTTALSGSTVQLRVPGSWLATATFPVTVDPLTSRVTVAGGVPNTYPEYTAIHTENISPVNNTMIAFERVFSATNIDTYAYVMSDNLSVGSLVFSYTTTSFALKPDVSFVVGANRWIVSFESRTGTNSRPVVYFHPRNETRFGIGFTRTLSGSNYVLPSVGGSLDPNSGFGLLVFESYSATGNSGILGCSIDAASGLLGAPFPITQNGVNAQEPDVNCQAAESDNGWIVTYTAKTGTADDYDIYVVRIGGAFAVGNTQLIGPDAQNGDKVHPVISGQGGRYMVAMLQDVEARVGLYFGKNLWIERIDWSNAAALPTSYGPTRLVSGSAYYLVNHHLAFDTATRSHWCAVYDLDQGPAILAVESHYAVLGPAYGVLESGRIDGGNSRYSPSVAYSARRGSFPLAFCQIEPVANGVYGMFVLHPLNASNSAYGSGCGPASLNSTTLPYAGSEFYELTLSNTPANQPAALWLASGSASINLGGYGAPSCFLNIGSVLVDLPFNTGFSGNVTVTLPLPEKFFGDLYWQGAYLWPSSPNPTPVGLTNGLRSNVR